MLAAKIDFSEEEVRNLDAVIKGDEEIMPDLAEKIHVWANDIYWTVRSAGSFNDREYILSFWRQGRVVRSYAVDSRIEFEDAVKRSEFPDSQRWQW